MKVRTIISWFVLVIALIFISTVLWLTYMQYSDKRAKSEQATYAQEQLRISDTRYTDLAAQEIMDKWQCLPMGEREEFVLGLMTRFAPEDRRTIERGRVRKLALEEKNKDGTLTVAERVELNSGYYSPISASAANENFHPPSCQMDNWQLSFSKSSATADELCRLPYMSITRIEDTFGAFDRPYTLHDARVVYEDKYSRWTSPKMGLLNEYLALRGLTKKGQGMDKVAFEKRLQELEQQEQHRQELRHKAQAIVANMQASKITAGSEKKQVEELYGELLCSE